MFTVPAPTAVTWPVFELTVATEALELLHDPPGVPLLVYVDDEPIQRGEAPLTVPAFTLADTVNAFDEETGLPHPLLIV